MASKHRARALYAHLRTGMVVYVHYVRRGLRKDRHLFGKPLTIIDISLSGITVRYYQEGRTRMAETRMRWGFMHSLQVSTEGTPEALEFILKGATA